MSPQIATIRRCVDADFDAMYAVINAAAEAYAGVIPADRYHVPYMPAAELRDEIAAGVRFWGWHDPEGVSGVMGIQDVDEVTLIRHAYVMPERQGAGIGSRLLAHLLSLQHQPLLVGTWADASWAVRFYERHGFRLVTPAEKDHLLRRYWSIPERQVDTSVVLRLIER
jgi:GNAT superfamily N-acetyltransferase